jgi:hypothetical protein
MRLLVLYQARNPQADHPGYFAGFERMVAAGQLGSHTAIGYLGVAAERGWECLWDEAGRAATETKADAVFLQFFQAPMPDPTRGIVSIKNLATRPLVFCSLGDPYGRWTHRVPRSFRVASGLCDVSFLTGMGYVARQLARQGSRNLVLMPNGCCQVQFAEPPPESLASPDFDIAFVGNRMRVRNPLNHFFSRARRRQEFVSAFTRRYGSRFAVFGNGWQGNGSWQGRIPYARQHEALRRAAVVVGGTPNADYEFYTSDRAFISVASGVPFVDYRVPGVERILVNGRDWWLEDSVEEMMQRCDRLLKKPAEERRRLAAETRLRILGQHTQYHRCLQMVEIVKNIRAAGQQGHPAAAPELPFLEGASSDGALIAWRG